MPLQKRRTACHQPTRVSYQLDKGLTTQQISDNFTAEVCKVINGQRDSQTIGMFRLSSLDENLELDEERGTTV